MNELCDECGHPVHLHGRYGCEYERGDRLVIGTNGVEALMAAGPCGCQEWEVEEFKDHEEAHEGYLQTMSGCDD